MKVTCKECNQVRDNYDFKDCPVCDMGGMLREVFQPLGVKDFGAVGDSESGEKPRTRVIAYDDTEADFRDFPLSDIDITGSTTVTLTDSTATWSDNMYGYALKMDGDTYKITGNNATTMTISVEEIPHRTMAIMQLVYTWTFILIVAIQQIF